MKQIAIKIIQILQSKGFKTYFAGGCVRDMLRSEIAKDFDIATEAKPEDIEKIFEKVIPIGKEFGVVLVSMENYVFEIATFRKEGEYKDGRRPSEISFCSAKEDAMRRDFTINGMFYDPITDEILDFVGGQKDLNEKLISFIGNSEERIKEDHLRIIRAVRFKNELGFQYEPTTYNALIKHAKLASKVSNERLRDELNKVMLSGKMINFLKDLHETNILKEILPEIEEMRGTAQPFFYHKEGDVLEHSLQTFAALAQDASFHLKWATLLHDIGKPSTYKYGTENREWRIENGELKTKNNIQNASRIQFNNHASKSHEIIEKLLKRLAFSKKDIEHIVWLTSHHMMMGNLLEINTGKKRTWYLHPWFHELLELFRVDIAGTDPSVYELYNRIAISYQDFLSHLEKEKPDLKTFLDGKEIMNMLNLTPGPKIGEILIHLNEQQLAENIKSKEEATIWINKFYKTIRPK